MTGNNLLFEDINRIMLDELKIIAYQDNNKLVISNLNDMPEYLFACCLYDENHVIVSKSKYQSNHSFFFDLDLLGLKRGENFSIRYYLRNIKNKKTAGKTFTQESIFFHKNIEVNSDFKQLFYKKIKEIIQNPNEQKSGSSIVLHKELVFKPFVATPNYNWDIWERDPFNSRTWQWQLHSFRFINQLLAYHHLSQNDEALDSAKEAIEHWTSIYFDLSGVTFEFVWHDHATALRAENLLNLLYYIENFTLGWREKNKQFIFKLKYLIFYMGIKLADYDFYTKHTNHGLEQVRVLLLVSLFFSQKDWLNIAKKRLLSEIKYSFTLEGVHKENSPSYHQFVFKIFLKILENYPDKFLEEVGEYFSEIAPKCLGFITHIIRPDGNLPIIGDTTLKPTTDGYRKYFLGTIEYEEFLYSFTKGMKGQKPREQLKLYAKSGYAIYRDSWHSKRSFSQSVHLIFKAGCLSSYHHQQDENHFVLYAYGEDWFIDSGLYKYVNKDPIRIYMRRREAHNVPIVSDSGYLYSNFEHRINNWSLSGEIDRQDYYLICGVNTVLQRVEHERKLKIPKNVKKNKFRFQVLDKIKGLDSTLRTVCFLWHIALDKHIIVDNNRVFISSIKTGKTMVIELEMPCKVVVEKGIVNNKISSCVSSSVGSVEDSWVIKVFYEKVDTLEIINQIYFE